jgi:hypothetical protein
MTDLIKQDCDHFWAHDHMGYAKKCIKCGKMVRMSFRSDSFIGRKIEEDNVTNIENHISPSTKVINR